MRCPRFCARLRPSVVRVPIKVALHIGHCQEHRNVPDASKKKPPGWVTGYLESFLFTISVAVDTAGVLPTMMTWLLVKLAANWQLREGWTYNQNGREEWPTK